MARAIFGPQTKTSNTMPTGLAGGTIGGKPSAAGSSPGRPQMNLGDEVYVWILVVVEVSALGWMRHYFRKHHGG